MHEGLRDFGFAVEILRVVNVVYNLGLHLLQSIYGFDVHGDVDGVVVVQ